MYTDGLPSPRTKGTIEYKGSILCVSYLSFLSFLRDKDHALSLDGHDIEVRAGLQFFVKCVQC